jgi:hypothetical protein
MVAQSSLPEEPQRGRSRMSRFQRLFWGCRSHDAVVHHVIASQNHDISMIPRTPIKNKNVRTKNTSLLLSDDDFDHQSPSSFSPYDTVSCSDEDGATRVVEVRRLRPSMTKQAPFSILPPTGEIVAHHDSAGGGGSFLSIDPILMTISTGRRPAPPTRLPAAYRYPTDADVKYHDRRDDDESLYYDDNDDDDISDITGFREYSLISM